MPSQGILYAGITYVVFSVTTDPSLKSSEPVSRHDWAPAIPALMHHTCNDSAVATQLVRVSVRIRIRT